MRQILLAALLVPSATAQDSKPDPLRATVERALQWIARQAQPVADHEDAVVFPSVAEAPRQRPPWLYGGTAGVLVFLENVAAAWNDARARKLADATARGLLAAGVREEGKGITWAAAGMTSRGAAGLYLGDAGVGQAFLVRARLRSDAAARATAVEIGDAIVARGERDGELLYWDDKSVDILSGAAGTALFLLDLHAETQEKRFLDAAAAVGRWLIGKSKLETSGGDEKRCLRSWWFTGGPSKQHMPGFSHGTAGVAYALVRIGQAAKDKACLEAGVDGAEWLLENAVREGELVKWAAVPGSKTFLGGWCHGPPGTARLLLLLHRQTGEKRYLDAALASARWVMAQAGPTDPKDKALPVFPPSQCCGVAGVVDFFCDLYRTTGEREFADFARRAADYLVQTAKADGQGVKWRNGSGAHGGSADRHGVDLMLGASGEAMALLRVLQLGEKTDPIRHLPDRSVGGR